MQSSYRNMIEFGRAYSSDAKLIFGMGLIRVAHLELGFFYTCILRAATRKASEVPSFKESLDKLGLGYADADADAFCVAMQKDSDMFKQLIVKLGLKA